MAAPQFSQKGRGGGRDFRRREKNRHRGGSSTAVTPASAATMCDCSSIEHNLQKKGEGVDPRIGFADRRWQ
jgi:hypothetical protein